MNKKIIIIAVLIVILGLSGYLLWRVKYQNVKENQPAANGGQENSTSTGNQEVQIITMQNFSFNPANVNIKSGTTIRWINEDTAPHDVTSDNFKSEMLNKGDFYEFKFDTVGT